jgi:hypothetical protein
VKSPDRSILLIVVYISFHWGELKIGRSHV